MARQEIPFVPLHLVRFTPRGECLLVEFGRGLDIGFRPHRRAMANQFVRLKRMRRAAARPNHPNVIPEFAP